MSVLRSVGTRYQQPSSLAQLAPRFASGAEFVYLPTTGKNSIVAPYSGQFVGSGGFGVGPIGTSYRLNAGDATTDRLNVTGKTVAIATGVSFLVVVSFSTRDDAGTLFGARDAGSNGLPGFDICIGYNAFTTAAGQLLCVQQSDAAEGWLYHTAGPTVNDGRPHTVVFCRTMSGGTGTVECYVDGTKAGFVWNGGTNTGANGAYLFSSDGVAFGVEPRFDAAGSGTTDQRFLDCHIHLGALIKGGIITQELARRISENPWQVFPANKRVFFFSADVSAVTSLPSRSTMLRQAVNRAATY